MMNPTQKVTLAVTVVVAAVVAFMVVNRSRQKRADRPDQVAASNIPDTTRSSELRIGASFPSVGLIAEPDSMDVTAHVDSRDLVAGRQAIVMFVAPNCEPCTAMVKTWSESLAGLPSDLVVFGVINAAPEERNAYRVVTDAMFPIYSDSTLTFGRQYGVSIYPTLVGLDASGSVVFVQNAVNSPVAPSTAVELLRSSSGP